MDVVTSEDEHLGTVVEERDDFTILESGHLRHVRHAIPQRFLHEVDGVLRTTLTKHQVDSSPHVADGALDLDALRAHYALNDTFVVEPDPDAPGGSAVPESAVQGTDPAHRVETLGGENDPSLDPSRET